MTTAEALAAIYDALNDDDLIDEEVIEEIEETMKAWREYNG